MYIQVNLAVYVTFLEQINILHGRWRVACDFCVAFHITAVNPFTAIYYVPPERIQCVSQMCCINIFLLRVSGKHVTVIKYLPGSKFAQYLSYTRKC